MHEYQGVDLRAIDQCESILEDRFPKETQQQRERLRGSPHGGLIPSSFRRKS
jgi:hypothetical protein